MSLDGKDWLEAIEMIKLNRNMVSIAGICHDKYP